MHPSKFFVSARKVFPVQDTKLERIYNSHYGNGVPAMFSLGWFKNPVSCQTDKLMAGTKFSDYLGLKHYKKAKN